MNSNFSNRIQQVGVRPVKDSGQSVVYICSRDQRAVCNHALLAAQKQAFELELPLVVVFNLYHHLPPRTQVQFKFMLEGLAQLETDLAEKNIKLSVLTGSLLDNLKQISTQFAPAAVYFDFSPFASSRKEKQQAAKQLQCPVLVVDTHNVIPAWIASEKQEYNAYFFRKKYQQKLDRFLHKPAKLKNHPHQWAGSLVNDWQSLTGGIEADTANQDISFKTGRQQAKKTLDQFLKHRLIDYNQLRNDPTEEVLSNLSPYLHFGQISGLEAALAVEEYVEIQTAELSNQQAKKLRKSKDAFLEQLLVRKELSDNYCFYNSSYQSLTGLPDWSQKTLAEHQQDERPHLYQLEQLEQAQTEDRAWNAAQLQMKNTGKMHGYMRMYWAKKILEWSPDPAAALEHAIYLNDRYSLDGYDPNGYVGILWSIGGLHDRPWPEREVFGKVRYMSFAGLKRKFNLQQYLDRWLDQPGRE